MSENNMVMLIWIIGINLIFYLIMSYKVRILRGEIEKQKIITDNLEQQFDNTLKHMQDILEYDMQILQQSKDLIITSEKINNDAEQVLALYKGICQKINTNSDKVVVSDSD